MSSSRRLLAAREVRGFR
ncbi:rCG42188, partial [Rattus norvegicus]